MHTFSESLIDLTEAVYRLDMEDAAWVPHLLEVAAPLLDQGLGVGAATYTVDPQSPEMFVHQKFTYGGVPDLQARVDRVAAEWPREAYVELMRPGLVSTLSDIASEQPEMLESYERHVDGVRDVLGITAVDPNGLGLLLAAMLPERATLKGRARVTWKMLGAHLAAGHRLRRAMAERASSVSDDGAKESSDLPLQAEAIIDSSTQSLKEAFGPARDREAAAGLREAAIQIDRARGAPRRDDPAAALKLWKGLTEGRWSLVDWFDSDDRRYILALPNAPTVTDPRGLTERESLVATYAMHGDTATLIGYRLGLSKASVSSTLKRVMKKLGVRTQAQLIERFRAFEPSMEAS